MILQTHHSVLLKKQSHVTYTSRSGFEFDDVYYVYDVEEVTPYAFDGTNETPGVYYLSLIHI